MDYLPLFLKLDQQPVLLIGGGQVALRKAKLMVRSGARVTAVAHHIHPELEQLLEGSGGKAMVGDYQASLLLGKTLAVAATDDEPLNQRVHDDAIAAGVPINVVDSPALCNFIFPAIVDRSPIVIGISSGGKAPVLVRALRAKFETIIPNGYSRLGELAGSFRERVKQRFKSMDQRRRFWESVLEGQAAEQVLAGREQDAIKLIEQKLAAEDPDHQTGEVFLVGAGPGDPELLTFKALRLMQQADVVLYDALVGEGVLELCRRDAELEFVGKRAGHHSMSQEAISQRLVELAQQGLRVVRLKGGDPFIFGRGGEELEVLKRAGVPFQVVPGVTAASACASYAGIPLTHRDYAQSVKFVTGQLKNRTADLDFAELAKPHQTVVFYMGLQKLPELRDGLLQAGMASSTPVAIISRATRPDQKTLIANLHNIVEQQQLEQLPGPALIVVGEVVSLEQQLHWFGDRIDRLEPIEA